METDTPTGKEWIATFAAAIGVATPDDQTFATLLELAGVAAHASERIAAPVACWLSATAGLEPATALAAAKAL